MTLQLEVWRLDQRCTFRLSWGDGQQLSAEMPYPESLTALYQDWRHSYFNFYKRLPLDEQTGTLTAESELRGQVEESGSLSLTEDRRFRLVQAEASLLTEFYTWLNSVQLVEIRQQIAQAARKQSEQATSEPEDIFLTCSSLELERLPWEAWKIGTEFASTTTIRIVRTPRNRRAETIQRSRRGRTRILAILGDDTGLSFETDRQAVRSLSRVAEIEFVGWKPGQNIIELPAQIAAAIEDEQGWDVLFFAGHSNETTIGGGELAIAPHKSISIHEIARSLTIAKERGLQFAIFNSCSGLNIATSLIGLGIAQVAVMREPIHNQVAHEFLVRFLQGLAEYKDVHDALLAACQYLKLERELTYPSAYLVPSLFRHPGSVPFRPIVPIGLKERLKQWLPTRQQAIALGSLLLLSLLPPVQNLLLEPRLWVQAAYRDVTGQVLPAVPPVLLVQIDPDSIKRSNIDARKLNPIDREYLASVIDQLQALEPGIVGIDFLLPQPTKEDQRLAQSVQATVSQSTWLVFAADEVNEVEVTSKVASLNWSLQGDVNAIPWYVELLPANAGCSDTCPFAYLLALIHALHQEPLLSPDLPQPQLQNQTNFRNQVVDFLNQGSPGDETTSFLKRLRLHASTSFSQGLAQQWLQPILDFSIPPNQVYDRLAAWRLLDESFNPVSLPRLQQQVVIVAAGGYPEADDNFPVPLAVAYWRGQQDSELKKQEVFTGGEAHAYMIHHLLRQHLVVPIPDLWMIGIAVILGKGVTLIMLKQRQRQRWAVGLVGVTALYGLVGLQVYISAAVLLPWLLPSAAFWVYVLPALRRSHA